ncbi:MAG: winged helix DNA-binding protein [Candidatus Puniceispirillaceae bacterium]|jgi:predicted MarR family transcription regulator
MTDQEPNHLPKGPDQPHKRIVSSSHLVSEKAVELSEVEYGLIVASNAFGMWIVKAMSAALVELGLNADLGVLDVLCLHSVNHRGRAKKLADICFKLNVEDSHTVNYALKKLVKYGLVQSEKQGKEVFYGTTQRGQALCMAYRDVRESCLVDEYAAFDGGGGKPNAASLSEVARQLRLLSGLYDQAARSATSF